jgi:GntR family transcriptional regulator, rspAB operon transcriptional repressor
MKNSNAQRSDDLAQKAFDYLIGQLASRKLEPGNLIEPKEIASALGISLSPVTRALHQLEHEGLIKIIPRKGSFVANSNPKSIFEQMMMREAIECQAARIYCGKTVEENLDKLLSMAEEIERTPTSFQEHWETEIQFHTFLVSLSACSSLARAFESSMRLGFFLRLNLFFQEMAPSESHVDLAKALVTNDPAKAEEAVRRHLRSGKPAHLQEYEVSKYKGWQEI